MTLRQVGTKYALLVAKHERSAAVLRGIAERIKRLAPECDLIWEAQLSERPMPPSLDLVISCGGDGTLLRAAGYFPDEHTPTFLPISGGSLGFMLPLSKSLEGEEGASIFIPTQSELDVAEAEGVLERIFKEGRPVRTMDRMRLTVGPAREERGRRGGLAPKPSFTSGLRTALNEVNVHRGSHPSLARIECAVDGTRLTSAIADGLLVATPTGSTAYSLSAGGPIVHPGVGGILLTPICPRSLSFRPALLPPDAVISIKRHVLSRAAPLQLSIDGGPPVPLAADATITVTQSPYPLRVICRQDATADWVHSVNSLLAWNLQFNERIDE